MFGVILSLLPRRLRRIVLDVFRVLRRVLLRIRWNLVSGLLIRWNNRFRGNLKWKTGILLRSRLILIVMIRTRGKLFISKRRNCRLSLSEFVVVVVKSFILNRLFNRPVIGRRLLMLWVAFLLMVVIRLLFFIFIMLRDAVLFG